MTDTISRIMQIRNGMTTDADAEAIIEREIAALQPHGRSSPDSRYGLLPCPFCGAPARTDLLPHAQGPGWVQCSECECDQHMSDTLEEAVVRWNTRAPLPSSAGSATLADKLTAMAHGLYSAAEAGILLEAAKALRGVAQPSWQPIIERLCKPESGHTIHDVVANYRAIRRDALAISSTPRHRPFCSCKASQRDGQHMAWCPAVTSTEGK